MIFSLILAASIAVQGSVASIQQAAPSDVPRNHWAFDAVDGLFREGLLVGYPPDGSFRGPATVSRLEMGAMLARMERELADVENANFKREPSRFESAVTAFAGYSKLHGEMNKVGAGSEQAEFKKRALHDLPLLIEAFDLFSEELKKLGTDPQEDLVEMRSDLSKLRK